MQPPCVRAIATTKYDIPLAFYSMYRIIFLHRSVVDFVVLILRDLYIKLIFFVIVSGKTLPIPPIHDPKNVKVQGFHLMFTSYSFSNGTLWFFLIYLLLHNFYTHYVPRCRVVEFLKLCVMVEKKIGMNVCALILCSLGSIYFNYISAHRYILTLLQSILLHPAALWKYVFAYIVLLYECSIIFFCSFSLRVYSVSLNGMIKNLRDFNERLGNIWWIRYSWGTRKSDYRLNLLIGN